MGKAAKWFRGLLGFKKHDSVSASTQPPPSSRPASTNPQKEKRRWSFVKSYREKDHQIATKLGGAAQSVVGADDVDPNKHAIAVAAATAAVAEAAVAAAHAAAAVVRLTSSRRCGNVAYGGGRSCEVHDDDEWWAAVKIQSAFRGYLARKALRALKGLVRLQAIVRGHIERKRTVEWLRQMQALLRAQARARAGRSQVSESSQSRSKSSQPYYLDPATPEKSEHVILRAKTTKYDQLSKLKELQRSLARVDDERSDKILEIDTGKHHFTTEHRNLLYPSQHAPSSDHESHSLATSKDSAQPTVKFTYEEVDSPFCTADNSPQFFSASSRGGSCRRSPFTPSKSDGFLSGYSDHPNYMAYTESSRAKARSLSAPKQRPHFERSGSSKRNSIHGFGDSRSASHKVSALHANFTNKAYPGSGRLDRIGMPLGFKC